MVYIVYWVHLLRPRGIGNMGQGTIDIYVELWMQNLMNVWVEDKCMGKGLVVRSFI